MDMDQTVAQTFTNSNPNRPYFVNPSGQLLWTSDSMFYGLTTGAGKNDKGFLYQINPYTNSLVNKIDFDDLGAESPSGSLMQASNGKLYGFTLLGGLYNKGIIFEYDLLTNTYVKKHDFDGVNGAFAVEKLIEVGSINIILVAFELDFIFIFSLFLPTPLSSISNIILFYL